LGSFLYAVAQNFEVFSNIQNENKKKIKKPVAVDDFFKAYPMIPGPVIQIQSGRAVPLKR
jgi:hypothetical protein